MMNENTEIETLDLSTAPDLDIEEAKDESADLEPEETLAAEGAESDDEEFKATDSEVSHETDEMGSVDVDSDEDEPEADDEEEPLAAESPYGADDDAPVPVFTAPSPAPVAVDPNAPAYEALLAQVAGLLASSPVTVGENKGFVKIESRVNGHKIYIAKQKVKAPRIETTVTLDAGFTPIEKPNGRIAGVLDPTPQALAAAIMVLSDPTSKLRAPLRKAA